MSVTQQHNPRPAPRQATPWEILLREVHLLLYKHPWHIFIIFSSHILLQEPELVLGAGEYFVPVGKPCLGFLRKLLPAYILARTTSLRRVVLTPAPGAAAGSVCVETAGGRCGEPMCGHLTERGDSRGQVLGGAAQSSASAGLSLPFLLLGDLISRR